MHNVYFRSIVVQNKCIDGMLSAKILQTRVESLCVDTKIITVYIEITAFFKTQEVIFDYFGLTALRDTVDLVASMIQE